MTNNIPYQLGPINTLHYMEQHTSCAHSLIRDDLVNYWIVLTNYLFRHSMGERGTAYIQQTIIKCWYYYDDDGNVFILIIIISTGKSIMMLLLFQWIVLKLWLGRERITSS